MLEKLDRLQLAGIFARDRLKKFQLQQQLQLDYAPDLDDKEIPTLDRFFAYNSANDLFDAPDNISNFWIGVRASIFLLALGVSSWCYRTTPQWEGIYVVR